MNYIIFDLEFNQGHKSTKETKNTTNPKCPFEIIQLGAIKLDENFNEVSTLNSLVKPSIYNIINPYVSEITGITLDMLKDAVPFNEVYKEFSQFVNDNDNILCVWGMSDLKELFRNIEYHKLDICTIPKQYINIQRHASKYFNCPKGINIGLQNAVELLNLPLNNQFHDAFNDAYYTAEVFKKLYNNVTIKPALYNFYNSINRTRTKNRKVDYKKLIEQFEKIYSRKMTEEEQAIIRLAYVMGKTNQFIQKS
jgi:DNA polymerase III epsilon subunit-like protein